MVNGLRSVRSKVFSVLALILIAVVLSNAGEMNMSGLVVLKPPVTMALLGDCDTPLSRISLVSSDSTPLLPQVEVTKKKDYHSNAWKGVSRIHHTPATR